MSNLSEPSLSRLSLTSLSSHLALTSVSMRGLELSMSANLKVNEDRLTMQRHISSTTPFVNVFFVTMHVPQFSYVERQRRA